MRCPTDGNELRLADRQGIEIDYCPSCRGVWLDRGELDKIIERTLPPPPPPWEGDPYHDDGGRYRGGWDDDDHREREGYGRRRRRGLLGDLFDFD